MINDQRADGWRPLELLPAVDVLDGRVVHLVKGVAGTEKVFGDPVEAALRWQHSGAKWVHLVDIDAAFARGDNRDLLREVIAAVAVDVELSGGIRDDDSLAAALSTPCRRVVIAADALANPDWCRRVIAAHGDRIAISLDLRGSVIAPRGGHDDVGELFATMTRLDAEGCCRYIVTDVARDGALTGPNLELLRSVCAATSRPVVASGGVATLDDLVALQAMCPVGLEGAVVGAALHGGRFTFEQALGVTRAT